MAISVSGWRRITPQMREKSFQYWIDTGSLTQAARLLEKEGYYNSKGKPYAVSQVSAQAHIYLLENFNNKPLIDDINRDRAKLELGPYTQEQFEHFLVQKAILLWGKKTHVARFWDWIERHGFEKYQDMWAFSNIPPRPINQPKRSASEAYTPQGLPE
jgi:hypothetical protein